MVCGVMKSHVLSGFIVTATGPGSTPEYPSFSTGYPGTFRTTKQTAGRPGLVLWLLITAAVKHDNIIYIG